VVLLMLLVPQFRVIALKVYGEDIAEIGRLQHLVHKFIDDWQQVT
jgi:hypothetical protein